MKVKDRVALVTGAGQGLGKAIAFALAAEGAAVAVNDHPMNEERAMKTVQELRERGAVSDWFKADVSNEEEVNAMVEEVRKKFGRIDILVNNAGINRDGILHKASEKDWEAVLAVNLTGPFLLTKAVLPGMREQNYGRIVNISSVTGRTGIFGTVYYTTAKTGLIGLTKVTAAENAKKGITCNAVAPGYIKTEMMLKYPEAQLKALIEKIPVGRLAEPSEIAEAVLFLASDSSSYITGSVLDINGGFLI